MPMTELQPAPEETPETALHHGRLGVLGIVFFVVAAAAPLVGMTGAVPVAIVAGNGAAAPGAYVVVGLILLLFSVGYAAMAEQGHQHRRVLRLRRAWPRHHPWRRLCVRVARGVPRRAAGRVRLLRRTRHRSDERHSSASTGPGTCGPSSRGRSCSACRCSRVDVGAKLLGVLMTLELLSLLVTSFAVFFSSDKPEGVDFGASFLPQNIFAGGLASTAGHRAGVRLRLLHRLRSHGDLRRGVEGPAQDRSRARPTPRSS